MARQLNDIIITGRIDNLVFYKMDGKGYARRASSLTGKQFKTKACFAGSRESALRFGSGNSIASRVYRSLPAEKRRYALFCVLKSKAIGLLKQELEPATIQDILKTFADSQVKDAATMFKQKARS